MTFRRLLGAPVRGFFARPVWRARTDLGTALDSIQPSSLSPHTPSPAPFTHSAVSARGPSAASSFCPAFAASFWAGSPTGGSTGTRGGPPSTTTRCRTTCASARRHASSPPGACACVLDRLCVWECGAGWGAALQVMVCSEPGLSPCTFGPPWGNWLVGLTLRSSSPPPHQVSSLPMLPLCHSTSHTHFRQDRVTSLR